MWYVVLTYRVFIKYCVFSKDFKIFRLWPFSVFPWCQYVYTHQAGRTPALQQNCQSSEKSQNFQEKTQYFMKTLYVSQITFQRMAALDIEARQEQLAGIMSPDINRAPVIVTVGTVFLNSPTCSRHLLAHFDYWNDYMYIN